MYQYGIRVRQHRFKCIGQHFTFFFLFNFSPHDIGTLDRTPSSTFPFYFYPLKILFLGRTGFLARNPKTPFIFYNFHGLFEFTMRLWVQTPTASLYFSLNSPLLPRGRGFNPHGSYFFYFPFSLNYPLLPWGHGFDSHASQFFLLFFSYSPLLPWGCWFDSYASHLYSFHFVSLSYRWEMVGSKTTPLNS